MGRIFIALSFLVVFASRAIAICSPCMDGYYCPDDFNSYPCPANSKCWACDPVVCNAGYYSTGSMSDGTIACHQCPAGFSCPAGTTEADLVKCPAGEYLSNGACVKCDSGLYYCPGDDMRHDCPSGLGYARTTFPDKYYNPTIVSMSISPEEVHTSISECRALVWMDSPRGELYEYVRFNPATQKYDYTTIYKWAGVKAGYYLTDKYGNLVGASYLYYDNVVPCVAGGYCPGRAREKATSDNIGADYLPNFGLEVCPDNTYSNAGASACTACPAKTGNNINTLAGHSGSASCLSLCGAGATKLHAGSYEFNMWSNGQCTTPALRIGLSGGTCCVNLQTGTASGALHIQTNGTTYHTVN